jgi:trigger factor
LKIELKDLEGCKRQLDIEIPGEIVNGEIARASEEMARVVRIPGFRPGHVPRSVVRQRFKTELRQEALRNLLPSALETAVEQHQLRVVGEPAVEKLDFADDGRVNFSVEVEVFPEFTVADVHGLALTKRVYKVTDEDVEKAINALREEAAELVADDTEGREARDGDTVSVDVEGKFVEAEGEEHGHAHEPIDLTDVSIEIGGEGVLPEFSDNLRGLKVGDSKTFRVDYPQDSSNARLAGHSVEYTARVVAIRVKDVPAFDDQFASEHGGEHETAEAWRAAIRQDLERRAEARTERELEDQAIDRLLEANQFPVPETLVKGQAQARLETFARSLAGRGADPRRLNFDWAALMEGARQSSERDVRAAMIVDRVAEMQKIEVSDEEVDAEIEKIAEQLGQPAAQVRGRLTKDGGADSIRNRIRHRKVLDLVVEAAQTTVEEVDGLDTQTAGAEGDRREENGAGEAAEQQE